jgi:hypothetical protein
MIEAKDAVVWVNRDKHKVMVRPHAWVWPELHGLGSGWSDPIGAAYAQWRRMDNKQRVQLMLETVIDLVTNDFEAATVLKAFAEIEEFRALGRQSYPMCRALTKALLGRSFEFNTMDFEQLLVHYAKDVPYGASNAHRD